MNRKTLTTTAAVMAIAGSAVMLGACGEEEQDITGTWKGSLSGFTLTEATNGKDTQNSSRNDTQGPIEVTIGKVDGNAFTATISLPVTGAKGTVKTKVPGVVSGEEDDLWMAGASGYYTGEVDGDEMELVYLKSLLLDPDSADGIVEIENVAQSGMFKRSE